MKVIADGRRRVTLPKPVHPGDVFDVEQQPNGRLVLTKLVKPTRPRAKLVKRADLLLLSSRATITWEETRRAMDEFP
jgi:hypothetical protein